MGKSLGLVIRFSGSGCKVTTWTEIELPGKLPEKSLFQLRNSDMNATPTWEGSGRLGSLPGDLPILCNFLVLTPRALALALVTPHQGGCPRQITCPDSLWLIHHHSIVAKESFPKDRSCHSPTHRIQCSLLGCIWHSRLSDIASGPIQLSRLPEAPQANPLITSCLVPLESSLPVGVYLLLHNPVKVFFQETFARDHNPAGPPWYFASPPSLRPHRHHILTICLFLIHSFCQCIFSEPQWMLGPHILSGRTEIQIQV